MYELSKLKAKDFAQVQIKNQAKIVEQYGSKLDPVKAYHLIKSKTKGFTIPHKLAKVADRMMVELLQKNGIQTASKPTVPDPTTSKKEETLRLQEQERARSLDLLQLELELMNKTPKT